MKIAIDESGDSGRKFWSGSSRWFILTAVIVPDNEYCGPACQAVDTYKRDSNNGSELHFAHNSHEKHVDFLEYMKSEDFIFASVVIDKMRLLRNNPKVFRSKMSLIQFAFDKLFFHLSPWLDNPIVLFDTNGPAQFNRGLSRHLLNEFGSKHQGDVTALTQVRSVDSAREPLVQLADYVCGAIHHHVRNPQGSKTFHDLLEDKGKIFFV